MYILISVLILIASVFMILIVLVQNSKGGGLSAGLSSSNQIMGVRKTTDFLEKATWTLAGSILLLCIVAAGFIPRAEQGEQSQVKELVKDAVVVDPNLVAPGFDAQSAPATTPAEGTSTTETPAAQEPAKEETK